MNVQPLSDRAGEIEPRLCVWWGPEGLEGCNGDVYSWMLLLLALDAAFDPKLEKNEASELEFQHSNALLKSSGLVVYCRRGDGCSHALFETPGVSDRLGLLEISIHWLQMKFKLSGSRFPFNERRIHFSAIASGESRKIVCCSTAIRWFHGSWCTCSSVTSCHFPLRRRSYSRISCLTLPVKTHLEMSRWQTHTPIQSKS